MRKLCSFFLVASIITSLATSGDVEASVKASGLFEATDACAANKKLRSENPGEIQTKIGEIYELIALNSETPSHFQITIPDAPVTTSRWVAANCGTVALDDSDLASKIKITAQPREAADKSNIVEAAEKVGEIENLLAASWLPTFCLTSDGKRAVECQRLKSSDIYAGQFSIHGLWPDDLDDKSYYPCYCGFDKPRSCSERQKAVSSIDISQALREELQTKMPGIQSGFLHRHEWTKHGTCYEKFNEGEGQGADAEEYYRDTIHILDQLNNSKVAKLFKDNIGKYLSDDAIYAAFDEEFGQGASDKVFIDCKSFNGDRHISELFIGLGGEITSESDLASLMKASPSRHKFAREKSCKSGRVTSVR